MNARKKILIVEDNPMNRALLSAILSTGYKVLEAENGQQALDVLKQYGEQISLILLDIIMPVMDGYTFLSKIKANPAYSSIPVIVTTQNDDESDEVAALSHGATDFVAKPYKAQIILHRVASIINLRETAAMMNLLQYDRLTGVYSKEFFYQRAKEILLRNPEEKYDIICSDIENFKIINDIFGIPTGDRLLRSIAQQYTKLVGSHGICGRLSADQFVCLLRRQKDYTDQVFLNASEKIRELSGLKNIIMKWGVYPIEAREVSVEQMCDRALLAARSVKGQYGKHFATYDDALRSQMLWEQAITDSMESALAEGQFEIYLQPKYSIAEGVMAGAEALVRWNHPEWGLQSPGQFIPLFEKSGFITKLDQFVWNEACAVLRKWKDKGYPSLPVSVNVSRADIYNADLAHALMEIVTAHGLSPSQLHLEITESAYTENPNQIIDTVGHLRKLGFIIEMDDFGSGYSSLNMLNQMPLDILKLDMKFIQSETAKPAHQGVLRFIMGIARSMGLSVVAEGVETKEQLERLEEIDCDYVQGYYFAKPMPCGEFELLMKEQLSLPKRPGSPSLCGTQDKLPILLLADEDAEYRKKNAVLLQGSYCIKEAENASETLACVTKYGHRIAAVLLSVTMGASDSFAVLSALQKEKSVWNIPVIVTGPADMLLEERALELGADDYAVKPHTQKSLMKRLKRTVGIASLYQREQELKEKAYRDSLTNLLNRRGLKAAVKALGRDDLPLAVYLLDLDHLKQTNDTQGHGAGDALIEEFSRLLSSHTRKTDILARFGGDEFVIIIPQMRSERRALEKGNEICRAMKEQRSWAAFPASCSAGLTWVTEKESLEMMLNKADEALYRAKLNKKGACSL